MARYVNLRREIAFALNLSPETPSDGLLAEIYRVRCHQLDLRSSLDLSPGLSDEELLAQVKRARVHQKLLNEQLEALVRLENEFSSLLDELDFSESDTQTQSVTARIILHVRKFVGWVETGGAE